MKLRAVMGAVLLGLASLTLVTGCSRERIDWKSAEAADTQEAYDHFLALHPDSALATQARARLAQLAEDKDWRRASAADTADAYRQFLEQHPSGKWAEEARIRVESFALDSHPSPTATLSGGMAAAAPAASLGAASPGTLAEPLRRTPGVRRPPAPPPGPPSKPAPVAPAKPAKPSSATAAPAARIASGDSAGFGIQLGAFSTRAAALGEWKRLQTTHDSELRGLVGNAVPVHMASGTLFRLQSPVGAEARAREICAALAKRGQPCVVVLPEKR